MAPLTLTGSQSFSPRQPPAARVAGVRPWVLQQGKDAPRVGSADPKDTPSQLVPQAVPRHRRKRAETDSLGGATKLAFSACFSDQSRSRPSNR
jgi:hypothetical protein